MLAHPMLAWLDRFAMGLRSVVESVSSVCVALEFAATLLKAVRQGRQQSSTTETISA